MEKKGLKGNNTMSLNQATTIQALQLWVDANFRFPTKVARVRLEKSTPHTDTFVVDLEESDTGETDRDE